MHEGQDVRGPPPCTPLHKHRPGPSTSRAGHDGCSRGPTSSWGSLNTETKHEKEPPPATQQPDPPLQVTQSQPHSPHSPCSCPERKRNRGSRERGTCEQSVHCTPTSLTHPTPHSVTHRVATGAGPRATHSGAPMRDSGWNLGMGQAEPPPHPVPPAPSRVPSCSRCWLSGNHLEIPTLPGLWASVSHPTVE